MNPTHWDIFRWGIDYGQLMMEEERDSEDWADAFQGFIIDQKYSMPAQTAPRRQPHSDKWREAKKESLNNFMIFAAQMKEQENKENK